MRFKVKPWGLETQWRTWTRLLIKICDAINNPDVKMWAFVAISFLVTRGTYSLRIRREKVLQTLKATSEIPQMPPGCSKVQSWLRTFLSYTTYYGWYKLKFQANKKGHELLSLLCTVPNFFQKRKYELILPWKSNKASKPNFLRTVSISFFEADIFMTSNVNKSKLSIQSVKEKNKFRMKVSIAR